MDPTTLVTFLFRAPSETRTVELLGSWDNFRTSYRMHHDRLRGSAFWAGCFKFDNIICDGDGIDWAKPRSGGLKQGGTYWYYYRLDYDIDAHDARRPHTTLCPLLPGQPVNVIEVPTEVVEPPSRSHSAHGYCDIVGNLTALATLQTLDPEDKYALLEPPPRSKVHARCISDDALHGRLENRPPMVVADAVSPVSPQSRQARPATPPSQSSKLLPEDLHERRMLFGSSSVYSRHTSISDAGSLLSAISEMSATEGERSTAIAIEHEHKRERRLLGSMLPDLPHPCRAILTPLASLGALGAALLESPYPASPAESKEGEIEAFDDHRRQRRSSAYTCGPESIANVQFYGSRPGSSLDEDSEQYRPRMYSLPSLELREYSDNSNSASSTCMHSPPESRLHENPIPCGEMDESVSPTFTATTLSTGGHSTPFRLSAQSAPDDAEDERHASRGSESPRSIRPRRSGSNTSGPRFFQRTVARLSPPPFMNYSLPRSATESDNSLAKMGSVPSGHELSLPSLLTTTSEEHAPSMADAIFRELGFLRESIH